MYLYGTKHHGITYWRPKPRTDLEEVLHYGTVSKEDQLFKYGDTYAHSNYMVHATLHGHWTGPRDNPWEESPLC